MFILNRPLTETETPLIHLPEPNLSEGPNYFGPNYSLPGEETGDGNNYMNIDLFSGTGELHLEWIDYLGSSHSYRSSMEVGNDEEIYFPNESDVFKSTRSGNVSVFGIGPLCKWLALRIITLENEETQEIENQVFMKCVKIEYAPFDADLYSEILETVEGAEQMAFEYA